MQLKNVVLPAPLGPMRETMARSGTWKLTSLTATRPPKTFEIASASSSAPPRGRSAIAAALAPAPSGAGWLVPWSLTAHLEELVVGLGADVVGLVDLGLPQLQPASRRGQEALGPQHHHDEQQE